MASGGVPAGGGDGEQDEGGQDHGGGTAVFASAEGVSGTDDSSGGGAYGAIVGAFGAEVGAGGAFEGTGRLAEFTAGGSGRSLGERVEKFAGADELGGGVFVIVLAEGGGGAFGDTGSLSSGLRRLRSAWERCARVRGTRFVVGLVVLVDWSCGKTFADLGQREVGGQLGAREPDRLSLTIAVAGQGNRVSEGVAGRGEALVDAESGFGQAGEELGLVDNPGDRLADAFAQDLARGAVVAGALGLEALGTGRVPGGGAVSGVELTQPEFLLDAAAFGLGALLVEGVARSPRTMVARMWMWSSAWRTATHRHPSGSPFSAMPVAWTTRRATSPHSASDR